MSNSLRHFILSFFFALTFVFTAVGCGGTEDTAVDAQLEATIEAGFEGEILEVENVSEALYSAAMTCEAAPTVCSLSRNCYWCDYGVGSGCICFDKPLGGSTQR